MQPIDQLSYILPTLSAVVDEIESGQLDSPTPCAAFTVSDILDHMIGLGGAFGYWFRGLEVPEAGEAVSDGSVPAAEFRAVMDALLDAVKSEGALERIITAPVGEMPGEAFARLVAFDGLVHGWDLATATGQKFEVPGCVIDAVDEFAHQALTDDMRDGDTFKDPTQAPADASQLERLAAFSGRSVAV
jgi:uncharacterized protein (TIGR03086 family)